MDVQFNRCQRSSRAESKLVPTVFASRGAEAQRFISFNAQQLHERFVVEHGCHSTGEFTLNKATKRDGVNEPNFLGLFVSGEIDREDKSHSGAIFRGCGMRIILGENLRSQEHAAKYLRNLRKFFINFPFSSSSGECGFETVISSYARGAENLVRSTFFATLSSLTTMT